MINELNLDGVVTCISFNFSADRVAIGFADSRVNI